MYNPHCHKPENVWTKLVNNSSKGFEEVKGIDEIRTESDKNALASDDA